MVITITKVTEVTPERLKDIWKEPKEKYDMNKTLLNEVEKLAEKIVERFPSVVWRGLVIDDRENRQRLYMGCIKEDILCFLKEIENPEPQEEPELCKIKDNRVLAIASVDPIEGTAVNYFTKIAKSVEEIKEGIVEICKNCKHELFNGNHRYMLNGVCSVVYRNNICGCRNPEPQEKTKMLDITAPELVEITIREDEKVIWVNVEGECKFRACKIGKIELDDRRSIIEPPLCKCGHEIMFDPQNDIDYLKNAMKFLEKTKLLWTDEEVKNQIEGRSELWISPYGINLLIQELRNQFDSRIDKRIAELEKEIKENGGRKFFEKYDEQIIAIVRELTKLKEVHVNV